MLCGSHMSRRRLSAGCNDAIETAVFARSGPDGILFTSRGDGR